MMVSKVLRTLEDKGFVTRHEHQTDTRAKTIALTPAGQALLQKALPVVEQTDIRFFEALKAETERFKTGMLRLLEENQ